MSRNRSHVVGKVICPLCKWPVAVVRGGLVRRHSVGGKRGPQARHYWRTGIKEPPPVPACGYSGKPAKGLPLAPTDANPDPDPSAMWPDKGAKRTPDIVEITVGKDGTGNFFASDQLVLVVRPSEGGMFTLTSWMPDRETAEICAARLRRVLKLTP